MNENMKHHTSDKAYDKNVSSFPGVSDVHEVSANTTNMTIVSDYRICSMKYAFIPKLWMLN